MSPLDLPPPPPNGTPVTVSQMIDRVAKRFLDEGSHPVLARTRAAIAVGTLMQDNLVELWGMSQNHEPLYALKERAPAQSKSSDKP